MKVLTGIQARSTSTRLPGKIFLPLGDSTVLEEVYRQCYVVTFPPWVTQYDVKILGPTNDDKLIEFCKEKCLPYELGSPLDLVDRYFSCSSGYDAFVRVTSDCPLIQPSMIELVLKHLETHDYVTNVSPRSFVDGFDCQAIKVPAYRWVWLNQTKEREHVFFDLDTNSETVRKFTELYTIHRIINGDPMIPNPYINDTKISIDTQEDYERVRRVYERKHVASTQSEGARAK